MQSKQSRVLSATLLFLILLVRPRVDNVVESSGPIMIYLPIIVQGHDVDSIGPDGGHVVSIAMDPDDPSIVYAGTWGAGMYKSSDGGETWDSINKGLENYYINTIAIDPVTPSIIYIGTQTGGVYKTLNGGESWIKVSEGLNQDSIVYSLAIDPSVPSTLYAGTRSPGSEPPWGGGVYKSENAGALWQRRIQGLGEEWVYSIAINPRQPKTLYAATHTAGVFKSEDGAENWSAVNMGITDLSTRSLVINPVNPENVLVGTWHRGGVYASTNGGESWSQTADGLNGAKIYRLEMDPGNPQVIYAATWASGVYKTINGGGAWNSSGLWPDFVYALAVDPGDSENVLAGTAGDGLYRSTSGGGDWSRSDTGLKATSVTALLFDPGSASVLYASVYGGGVARTVDRGDTWTWVNSGLDDKRVHMIAMSSQNPFTLYAATNSSGVYRSLDGGASWSPANTGFPAFSQASAESNSPFDAHQNDSIVDQGLLDDYRLDANEPASLSFGGTNLSVRTIEINGSTPTTLYAGTSGEGVFKSSNSGDTWSATGLTTGDVHALAIDPNNGNNIFAAVGATDGSMLRTFDGGMNWVFMNSGLNGQTMYAVVFDASTPGKMIAGAKDGAYISTSSGNSWSLTSLSGVAVYYLKINEINSEIIYAGTEAGFYISSDGGVSWDLDNAGLVNPIVQSLAFDMEGNRIFLGSQGSGSYRRRGLLP